MNFLKIIHELTIDLLHRSVRPWVEAVQGEGWCREVALTLLAGGEPFPVPEGCAVAVRYRSPDGHGGIYDTTPGGTPAWRASGNVLTLALAEQMLCVPGDALVDVLLTENGQALGVFAFTVRVEEDPAAQLAENRDYFSLARVDAAYAELEQCLQGVPDAVAQWLNAHPEATTSVTDGSVTLSKLAPEVRRGLILEEQARLLIAILRGLNQGADMSGEIGALEALVTDPATDTSPRLGLAVLGRMILGDE